MKAIAITGLNAPLQAIDLEQPQPEAHQLMIKLHYAAFNHRDHWIQKGQYANIVYPSILGSDGAGEIVQVGSAVTNWSVGQEVIINPGLQILS